MVGHEGLTYAGNHGLEIRGPGIEDFAHEDLTHYQARTAELAAAANKAVTPEVVGRVNELLGRPADPELDEAIADAINDPPPAGEHSSGAETTP